MEASFFIILFFVLVGVLSLVKMLSKNDSSESGSFQITYLSEPIPIGSFSAKQLDDSNLGHIITCTMRYTEADKMIIILIDGRKLAVKMKLDKCGREEFINIINKSIDWGQKAVEANISCTKPISNIKCQVSFNFANGTYTRDSDIKFNLFNIPGSENGYELMVNSNAYNVDESTLPPSVIFIENAELDKIKTMVSEENIDSKVNTYLENKKKGEEIFV